MTLAPLPANLTVGPNPVQFADICGSGKGHAKWRRSLCPIRTCTFVVGEHTPGFHDPVTNCVLYEQATGTLGGVVVSIVSG